VPRGRAGFAKSGGGGCDSLTWREGQASGLARWRVAEFCGPQLSRGPASQKSLAARLAQPGAGPIPGPAILKLNHLPNPPDPPPPHRSTPSPTMAPASTAADSKPKRKRQRKRKAASSDESSSSSDDSSSEDDAPTPAAAPSAPSPPSEQDDSSSSDSSSSDSDSEPELRGRRRGRKVAAKQAEQAAAGEAAGAAAGPASYARPYPARSPSPEGLVPNNVPLGQGAFPALRALAKGAILDGQPTGEQAVEGTEEEQAREVQFGEWWRARLVSEFEKDLAPLAAVSGWLFL